MTIKYIQEIMSHYDNFVYCKGDIDDYWKRGNITFMLTHTSWCEGEDNDKHTLLLFVDDENGNNLTTIPLVEFTEKIQED